MREVSKRSSARKAAKVWTAAMATNRMNGSSVSVLLAFSEQVATPHWGQIANSKKEMIAFFEEHSTLALEDRWAVDATGS